MKKERMESKLEKRLLTTKSDITLDNSFVRSSENFLKEQFYFRDNILEGYYSIKNNLNKNGEYLLKGISNIKNNNPFDGESIYELDYSYISDDVIELKDSYLINKILEYKDDELLQSASRGRNIAEINEKYDDVKIYVYFISRLEEFLNSEKNNLPLDRYEFIKNLNENIKHSSLDIDNYNDYKKYYYKTDRHLSADGAYKMYEDIIEMINDDFNIGNKKRIKERIEYDYEFYGNISSQVGRYGKADHLSDIILDNITEYEYFVNGQKADINLAKEEYKKNGNQTVYSDYDYYFGANYFLKVFDFKQKDKPNILIFGDSYLNSNMEWIASHFNKTVIIDLRSKSDDYSTKKFIEEYDIDIILVTYAYHDMFKEGHMYIPIE